MFCKLIFNRGIEGLVLYRLKMEEKVTSRKWEVDRYSRICL